MQGCSSSSWRCTGQVRSSSLKIIDLLTTTDPQHNLGPVTNPLCARFRAPSPKKRTAPQQSPLQCHTCGGLSSTGMLPGANTAPSVEFVLCVPSELLHGCTCVLQGSFLPLESSAAPAAGQVLGCEAGTQKTSLGAEWEPGCL